MIRGTIIITTLPDSSWKHLVCALTLAWITDDELHQHILISCIINRQYATPASLSRAPLLQLSGREWRLVKSRPILRPKKVIVPSLHSQFSITDTRFRCAGLSSVMTKWTGVLTLRFYLLVKRLARWARGGNEHEARHGKLVHGARSGKGCARVHLRWASKSSSESYFKRSANLPGRPRYCGRP